MEEEFVTVAPINRDLTETSDEDEEPPPKCRRGEAKAWTKTNVCPRFMKKNICKHTVGMEIWLGMCDAPAMAKTVPIGQKRKRGRPAKAKPALIRQ